jgi:hypothetical protein
MEFAGKWYIEHPSRTNEFLIWPFGDVHYGNRGCAVGMLKRDVETVRVNPFAFWFGLGDMADYIAPHDKRFDATVVGPDISLEESGGLGAVLCRQVGEILAPIAHKCLGLGIGNHETTYERTTNQNRLHFDLLKSLSDRARTQIPHFGYTAMFDLVFVRNPRRKGIPKPCRIAPLVQGLERHSYRFVVEHGSGAARSRGGKANKLETMAQRFEADICVQGHLHDPDAFPVTRIAANEPCTEAQSRDILLVRTGSYLRTYTQGVLTYSEERGYNPTTLGAKPIHIQPTHRRVWAEIGISKREHAPVESPKGE